MNAPPPFPAAPAAPLKKGLSVTSFVLGLLSPAPCFACTGIPAIVMGHIAYRRAKKQPQIYGGAGLALAGLILGYIGIVTSLIGSGLVLPALAKFKNRSQSINCVNNLKQIGLAGRIYASDHNGKFPADFLSMTNELNSPKILVCNGDSSKTKLEDWGGFDPALHATYLFEKPGWKVDEATAGDTVIFRCPIHNNVGLGDGSVQQNAGRRRK